MADPINTSLSFFFFGLGNNTSIFFQENNNTTGNPRQTNIEYLLKNHVINRLRVGKFTKWGQLEIL